MQPGGTKIAIMTSFLSMQEYSQKSYTWMKRKTIQAMLKKYHNIEISLSALDKHLADFNKMGFLKTFQRRGHNPDGTIFNLTSNRMLTRKAILYLLSLSVRISTWLFKRMFKTVSKAPEAPKADYQSILDDDSADQNEKADAYSALLKSLQFKPI